MYQGLLVTITACLAAGVSASSCSADSKVDCTYQWPAVSGDTCDSLGSDWGLTGSQFPDLNPCVDCSKPLVAGQNYCVEGTVSSGGGVGGSSPSTTTRTTFATSTTKFNSLHPSPEQTGIVSDCTRFYQLQPDVYCQDIVDLYDNEFTLQQFYDWNPAVGQCEYLLVGDYYCVGVPGTPTSAPSTSSEPHMPHQTGIASDCTKWYQAVAHDNCQAIANKYGTFSASQFEQWNPAVGDTCAYLIAGDWYCVGVLGTPTSAPTTTSDAHSPHQTSVVASCDRWYQAVADDSCQGIVDKYGTFSLSQFEQWNPAVGSSCAYLLVGDWYCIGVPGTPTTRPTTSSDTHEPHQTGIASNCDKWYMVENNDTCDAVAGKFGVSLDQFYSWNPAVGTNCEYLWVGYNVCVGVN